MVPYSYFIASCATLTLAPLLCFIALCMFTDSFDFLGTSCCNPVKLVVGYLMSCAVVYIVIPLWDINSGFQNLFWHEKYKQREEDEEIKSVKHKDAAQLKLPEQIGEAVPQFIIAAMFYSKNSSWLSTREMWQGGLTMALSVGSIILGMTNGCLLFCQNDTNKEKTGQDNSTNKV